MFSMVTFCKYKEIAKEKDSHIDEIDNKLIKENLPQNFGISLINYSVRIGLGTNLVLKNLNINKQLNAKNWSLW